MAGLQGVGKTTACGKLALALKNENRKVLLVATDVYRPAAIEQLQLLGKRAGVEVFDMGSEAKPVDIANKGIEKARSEDFDTVIVDTAGRLQVRFDCYLSTLFLKPSNLKLDDWYTKDPTSSLHRFLVSTT